MRYTARILLGKEKDMKKTTLAAGTAKRKKHFMSRDELQMYSLCVIPIILVIMFSYLPMSGIIMAFKNYRYDLGIFGSEWVGLNNFKVFLMGGEFPRLVRNTVGMNLLIIFAEIIAALFIAVLLFNLTSRRAVKTYQTIFILPFFVSWVMVAYVVYALLAPNEGTINQLLALLGFEKVNWYSEPKYWPAILTICSVWKNVGMKSIYYYAALMGVDETLFEAAEVDGASPMQKTTKIMIPCILPTIVILFIMSIGGIFGGDFGLFYQVPKNIGALYETTDVITTYNFRTMKVVGNMGLATAISLFSSVVGIIMVLITNKLSTRVDEDLGLF